MIVEGVDDWEMAPPSRGFILWSAHGNRERRRERVRRAFVSGMRVEVTGPFEMRTGPGTIRHVTMTGRGVVVDLDSGHDVLVARRFAQPLVDTRT